MRNKSVKETFDPEKGTFLLEIKYNNMAKVKNILLLYSNMV